MYMTCEYILYESVRNMIIVFVKNIGIKVNGFQEKWYKG